jgi:hypothetical protein
MKVDTEIKIFQSVVAVVVIGLALWVASMGWNKYSNWKDSIDKRDRIAAAKKAVYRARLPKAGDRVVLNDANVSVVKEFFWTQKFRVRYDNGTMALVHEREMLDLKKVKHKIPEKRKTVSLDVAIK